MEGQPLRTATCRDTSRRYMQANTANPVKRLYCHYIGAREAPQRQGCIVLSRWNQCAAAKKNCPTLMLALKHASSNHNRCGHYGLLPRAVRDTGCSGPIPGQLQVAPSLLLLPITPNPCVTVGSHVGTSARCEGRGATGRSGGRPGVDGRQVAPAPVHSKAPRQIECHRPSRARLSRHPLGQEVEWWSGQDRSGGCLGGRVAVPGPAPTAK